MFNKDDNDIQIMSEAEIKNPALIKERDDFNSHPISIYFGSERKELTHVCDNCLKKFTCPDHKQVLEFRKALKENLYNPEVTGDQFQKSELDRMSKNVFIIVNCIFKEEE